MRRRDALRLAAAFGASLAWPSARLVGARAQWRERRDLFPEGVGSGDPHPDSVLLWTRRPPGQAGQATTLLLELATDPGFATVVSRAHAPISAESDWTCRVLAGGLEPARVYWYRFTDQRGNGSRIGRTITAPTPNDDRAVQFAFVSCQNVQQGACNAYRRMIFEDERRPPPDQLNFVLHLGDYVYELVWYPEDRPQGMYDRRLKDLVRYANGEKIADFHIPTTVDDYRALYRAYLADPDLQDARARWPFVCVWDNHEFSWKGWQSQQVFGRSRPAQTRKAAANQAWFEYQPARVVMPGTRSLDRFASPRVADAPIERFDSSGLGLEPGNLAAIESLRIHRTLRFGRNADLLLTDNRSFRSEPLTDRPETQPFKPTGFPFAVSEDIVAVLDGGRSYRDGNPPATIPFDGQDLPNPRRDSPPQSMLGAAQKAWFLDRLERSDARWKLWGNSVAMLDWRIDWHRLPDDFGLKWPTTGYALLGDEDWSGYRAERAEIFDRIKRKGITGFASVAGDRHSFLAGLISPTLPPDRFEPVGVEFVTGSVSAPGLVEVAEHSIPKTSPLHPVLVGPGRVNTTLLQGVRSTLALARTGDANQARAARNPELAPHLVFADLGGHGYTMIRATPDALEAELVSIPRPIERSQQPDGGPLAYRVRLRTPLWSQGGTPRLERELIEGTLPFLE